MTTDASQGGAAQERTPDGLPEIYCPSCGSCGITDCCGLRCSYLASHREDFREMEEDAEQWYQRATAAESVMRSACVLLADDLGRADKVLTLEKVIHAYTLMFDFLHTDIDADAAPPEQGRPTGEAA